MVLDQNNVNKIIEFLNLENITIIQRIELLVSPKKIEDDFDDKIQFLKKELGHNVTIRIVEKGELGDGKTYIPAKS